MSLHDLSVIPGTEDGPPSLTVQHLLDQESVPVPEVLRLASTMPLDDVDVPVDRYTSRAFYDTEVERLWSRTWQMACREEVIPNVGDVYVYRIINRSILVVRTGPDEIKAYPNACLHRGTELCVTDGNVAELRCPFHGFCWELNGSLSDIPSVWDFPGLDRSAMGLPEVKVGTWQGFVFVNPDPDAEPLEKFLGGIVHHFETGARPSLSERYTRVHVAKVIDANWKATMEAFLESYHVIATHPQTMDYIGDAYTQYDVFPGEPHWSRMITPMGVPSPHLGPDVTDQATAEALRRDEFVPDSGHDVPDGYTARKMLADALRHNMEQASGFDAAGLTDCESADGIEYFVFPNFVPWLGIGVPFVYRFRPWDDRVDRCLMEIMILHPVPAGEPRPPAVPMHLLSDDEDFTAAAELGALGPGFNQDLDNLPRVQRGLNSTVRSQLFLSRYQESRIKHFHKVLCEYISD